MGTKPPRKSVFWLFCTMFLASCGSGQEQPSANNSTPTVLKDTEQQLILHGNPSGQTVGGSVAALTADNDALSQDVQMTVTRLDPKSAPKLPPVDGIYATFLLGEVPGSKVTGAWRVQIDNKAQFEKMASLEVQRETSLSGQSLDQTITEVFVKDNTSGEIHLAHTFFGQQDLDIVDFADRVNEKGGTVDFTYVAYTANFKDYVKTCLEQGGEIVSDVCSFANKDVAPQVVGSNTNLKVVSWNVGNVDSVCEPYNYKLCYHSTQRRVTERLIDIERKGKPAVVMLQEMWNGQCKNVKNDGKAKPSDPRLCEKDPNIKSAEQIFGDRYAWTCTQAAHDSKVKKEVKVGNGWECVGVDRAQMEIVNATPEGPLGFHPTCSNYDQGFDTGYQPVILRNKITRKTFYVVNTHLTSVFNVLCRKTQIEGLEKKLREWGSPDVIIAGDFNTEPFSSTDIGAASFRRLFVNKSELAKLISDGKTITAVYGERLKMSLDHVLGKNFTGNCLVAGEFSGMDHRMMTCVLKHVPK